MFLKNRVLNFLRDFVYYKYIMFYSAGLVISTQLKTGFTKKLSIAYVQMRYETTFFGQKSTGQTSFS
jgi:hypothetical protein